MLGAGEWACPPVTLCAWLCCRYGFRYSAKVLRDALKAKFPAASEEELYKVASRGGGTPTL